MKGMQKHEIAGGEAKAMLAKLIGSKPRDLYRLSGIYRGLMAEKGPAIATAAIVEIIRTTNQKRAQKLSWLRRASATPPIFQVPAEHEKKKPAAQRKHHKKNKSHR